MAIGWGFQPWTTFLKKWFWYLQKKGPLGLCLGIDVSFCDVSLGYPIWTWSSLLVPSFLCCFGFFFNRSVLKLLLQQFLCKIGKQFGSSWNNDHVRWYQSLHFCKQSKTAPSAVVKILLIVMNRRRKGRSRAAAAAILQEDLQGYTEAIDTCFGTKQLHSNSPI